jgi:NAD-dependent deacetylase
MDGMYRQEQAISLIRKSTHIVALCGAGMSTEAGIPDFRSAGGLWDDADLMKRLSASGFREDPAGFYAGSMKLFSTMARAQPTSAHRLLAKLEELRKLEAVVTQNIDGLHHAAGSRNVYEVHGTYRTGHCTRCGVKFEMELFYAEIERGHMQVPTCEKCAVPIKPDVVLFGELLPVDAWQSSVNAAEQCDLMLILGSSLMVYPVAELPGIALSHGAGMVIVNLDSTGYDNLATVTIRGRLGEFAEAALAAFI